VAAVFRSVMVVMEWNKICETPWQVAMGEGDPLTTWLGGDHLRHDPHCSCNKGCSENSGHTRTRGCGVTRRFRAGFAC